MSKPPVQYNVEGHPLRIHELDIEKLALWLNEKRIRTTQGKIIQPLHAGHIEVINDPARYKVLAAGRRFGKTLLTALMALSVMMQVNRRVWIVSKDYSLTEKVFRELYNILVNQLRIIVPGKEGKARNQKGEYYLETPWGSVLEAKSMENPDSLAGEANDLVIIDEAALDPRLEDIWTQMISPTLADKKGSAVFISTPRGKNSFYKLYTFGQLGMKQRAGKVQITFDEENGQSNDMTDWSSFKKTSYDNPYIPKEEIDSAHRRAVLSGKLQSFKQEWLSDFESVSDICFPGFVEEATEENPYPNVVDYIYHPDEGPVFAACDHNFAKPASTIFAQMNQYGDIIIFDEKFTRHTTTYMQAQQILEKEAELNRNAFKIWEKEMQLAKNRVHIRFKNIVADISGDQVQLNGRTAWDDFEEVLGRRPSGFKQDRETGCNLIRLWMKYPLFGPQGQPLLDDNNNAVTRPKLFITPNCVNLRYALSSAVFKKAKGGSLKEDYEETPEGYEGLLDALRYLMVFLLHDTGTHFTLIKGAI
jgi:hypothetical protein